MLKNIHSRNFGGEGGGVKVIWRNPDLTGFSLMSASLKDANHITFQVDSQNIMNCERGLHFQNKGLANNKRASVEHVLKFSAFKRRKLDKVGYRTITFDTFF